MKCSTVSERHFFLILTAAERKKNTQKNIKKDVNRFGTKKMCTHYRVCIEESLVEEKIGKMMERKLMNIHCNGHTSTQHELQLF
jgi:transcription antitermination factor NusG